MVTARNPYVLLFLAGCSAEIIPVGVTFSLDEVTCGSTDMGEVAINGDCGGTIEVQLTDEETPGSLYGSQCINLGGETYFADDLPALIAPHFKVTAPPGAVVSLELATHSSPVDRTCKDAPRRLIGDDPILVGRSEPVKLESDAAIEVPLTCQSRPRSCTVSPVVDEQIAVAAGIRDLVTLAPLDNTPVFDVSFGYVLPENTPATWQLVKELIYADDLLWDTPHRFVLADPLPGNCYGTRVNWTNDETSTTSSYLSCEGTLVGQNLTTQGYFVDPVLVADMVKALDYLRVPPGGLLVGRVVDPMDLPVAGAVVRAEGPEGVAVHYFTDEVPMRASSASTSRNGLFAVVEWSPGDPTCCVDFTAQSFDFAGRTAAPTGLAKGLVSTSLIRVVPRQP